MNMLAQFSQNQKAIEIDGAVIRQDHHGRYCLNDLHKASGEEIKNRPATWLQNQQTQALAVEVEKDGIPSIYTKQGVGTFVRKELVYAYAMWISATFHLKVIRTFDAVATGAIQPQKPAELSRMEILQIAMESEKENIALRGELATAAPKAQALDTIADTSQTYCLRECAKTIGIKESDLIDLLLLKKWVYREPSSSPKKKGKLQPYAQYVTCGVFINRASPVMADGFGVERVHLNMQVTAFGLTRITGLVNKNKVGAV